MKSKENLVFLGMMGSGKSSIGALVANKLKLNFVDIDEEIVEAYGGYPLPRSLYSNIISRTEGTAGITILMPDPDIRGSVEDEYLAEILTIHPAVLAYTASNQATQVGPHVGTAQLGGDPSEWLLTYPGILRQQRQILDP